MTPFTRTPFSGGNVPVMIDACDGSVRGAVLRAPVKRAPRAASPSIAGVSPRPTRSARRVSIVMRRTLGFWMGAGGVLLLQLARSRRKTPPTRFTLQLSPEAANAYSARIALRGSMRAARRAGR
jgi:hypothetical protein